MDEEEIIAILRRYRVQGHWQATKEAGGARYAIFTSGGQVSGTMGHREARQAQEKLIAADILALAGGDCAE